MVRQADSDADRSDAAASLLIAPQSEGWPMTLGEYEQLVQLARPDVDK